MKGLSKTLLDLSLGKEPVNDGTWTIIRCLNWYSNMKSTKDSKNYFIKYLINNNYKKEDIEIIEKINDEYFNNVGFVVRLLDRGFELTPKQFLFIKTKFEYLKSLKREVEVVKEVPVSKVEKDEALEPINYIEGIVDQFIKTGKFTFNCLEYLKSNNYKKSVLEEIKSFYSKGYEELKLAYEGDEETLEYYSGYSKKEIKNFYLLLESIVTACDELMNVRIERKPRKKKPVPLEKILKHFRYLKEHENLKSVHPKDIIGAKEVIVYDTRYRKLGYYISNDSKGFSIHRSNIENFNEEKSFNKILRKPEEILPSFLSDPKLTLQKTFDTIKTTAQKLTGRINEEVLILRVIK